MHSLCNFWGWTEITGNLEFTGGSAVKNLPANSRDTSSIPGLGRSPGGGNGNPLQCSCLKNPMDSGAYSPKVTKNSTQSSTRDMRSRAHAHVLHPSVI